VVAGPPEAGLGAEDGVEILAENGEIAGVLIRKSS